MLRLLGAMVAGLLAEAGHEITRTDPPPYPFDLRAQVRFS